MQSTKLSCSLICAAICAFLLYSSVSSVYIIGICNIISLFVGINAIKKIQGSFLSPLILITICLYIFHSGHLWLSLINISPSSFLTSFDYEYQTTNYDYILNVYREITILLSLFIVVSILFVKPINKAFKGRECGTVLVTNRFRKSFFLLYIISMFFELKRAIAVAATSYGEGYLYGSSIEQYIVGFVNVILLLFLYIYRNDKNKFNLYLGLQLFRTFFIMFFVGNRGSSIIYLIVTAFIVTNYSYLASRKRYIRNVSILVVGFMLIALPFISATRGGSRENMSVSQFVEKNNPIESFLEEFGGTVANVFLTKEYVDAYGSTNGIQIIGTSLSILPGSTSLFGDIIRENVSIGMKLNNFANRQGLGGSLLSQLYFNFSEFWLLCLSVAVVSLLMVWTSNQLMNNGGSLFYTLFLLCLFSGLITWVRGEWYDVITQVKMCVYVIILLKISKNNLLIINE